MRSNHLEERRRSHRRKGQERESEREKQKLLACSNSSSTKALNTVLTLYLLHTQSPPHIVHYRVHVPTLYVHVHCTPCTRMHVHVYDQGGGGGGGGGETINLGDPSLGTSNIGIPSRSGWRRGERSQADHPLMPPVRCCCWPGLARQYASWQVLRRDQESTHT